MPRESTGEVRRNSSGLLVTRIRVGGDRESFDLPTCRTDDEARERSAVLAKLAKRFDAAPHVAAKDAIETLRMAGTASEKSLRTVLSLAEELLGGELEPMGEKLPSFGAVVTMWATGDLARKFPHQIKMAGQGHLDAAEARVKKPCFDPIRDVPVNRITRALCDEVMRHVPLPPGKSEISGSTLRQYGVLITRVLNLAELAGYIERSPIPKGWLPSAGARKRFPILYPGEDRTLLACKKVPLAWRIYYGFLHREGVRREEAASLQLRDLDLEHGTVSLDENKTNHPRFWKLGPGVAAALKAYTEARKAGPDDFVFVDENGGPLRMDHMADRVRAHLASADIARPDLTSAGPLKGKFGTHGFRRSMVTRNLALGRTDDWVRQRTGHTTDELLRYRQGSKSLAELSLGDLEPLNEAIPEHRLPRDCPVIRRGERIRTSDPLTPSRYQGAEAPGNEEFPEENDDDGADGSHSSEVSGHSRGNPDPIEAALAASLDRASIAGQWDVVAALATELEARRRARAAPNVVPLSGSRRRGER